AVAWSSIPRSGICRPNRKVVSGSLRLPSSAIRSSLLLAELRSFVFAELLRHPDDDELRRQCRSHAHLDVEASSVHFFRWVGLIITFYVKRLLGTPSSKHALLVELIEERADPGLHCFPGVARVGLEHRPPAPLLQAAPQHDEQPAHVDEPPIDVRRRGPRPPRPDAAVYAEPVHAL